MPPPETAPGWVPELHIAMRKGNTFDLRCADGLRRKFALFAMDEHNGITLTVYFDPATEDEATVFAGGESIEATSLKRCYIGTACLLESTDGHVVHKALRLPDQLAVDEWEPANKAPLWKTVYLMDHSGRMGLGYNQDEQGWMILSAPKGFVPARYQSAAPFKQEGGQH